MIFFLFVLIWCNFRIVYWICFQSWCCYFIVIWIRSIDRKCFDYNYITVVTHQKSIFLGVKLLIISSFSLCSMIWVVLSNLNLENSSFYHHLPSKEFMFLCTLHFFVKVLLHSYFSFLFAPDFDQIDKLFSFSCLVESYTFIYSRSCTMFLQIIKYE